MDVIEPNAYVVLDYELRDDSGEVVDSSKSEGGEKIVYVHGYGMLVPGLEKALLGLKTGDAKKVEVAPEEGFGEHDEELVLEIDRGELPNPEKVAVGDELVAESPDGEEVVMRVLEVNEDAVKVDANHPLAGKRLVYDVTIREVRKATDEEVAAAAMAFEAAGYGNEGPPDEGVDSNLVQLGSKPLRR